MEMNVKLVDMVKVASRGMECQVDIGKLSADIVAKLVIHGLVQKVADNAASAGTLAGESHFGKAKKDVPAGDWKAWAESERGKKAAGDIALSAMETARDALYKGEWSVRGEATAVKSFADPVEALAWANVKTALFARIKAVTKLAKFKDLAAHEKSAKFFQVKGDVIAWNDSAVKEWAEPKWEEYLASAREALAETDDMDI